VRRAPREFELLRRPPCFLYVARRHVAAVREQKLDDPKRWEAILAEGDGTRAGRGSVGRIRLSTGLPVILKKMRRGGLAADVWRDRFLGTGRLMDNLRVPLEAAGRGIATAAPVALLLVSGPPGLYRGWLAVEEIEGARDLASRYASGPAPSTAELSSVFRLLRRMHDAGVEHRDLNLGNLLLRNGRDGVVEAFVVDLDRARLRVASLPFRTRLGSLRRLERSYAKRFGGRSSGRSTPDLSPWCDLYAAGDERLARRLRRGRGRGRVALFLHRIGWWLRGE
jgi:3-deoxy-D-manno-octulosonic acid kinase